MQFRDRKEMLEERNKKDIGAMMGTTIKDISKSDGWVIQNLRKYHNSIIPKSALEAVNGRKDLLPALIEYASGIPVEISSEGDSLIAWEKL